MERSRDRRSCDRSASARARRRALTHRRHHACGKSSAHGDADCLAIADVVNANCVADSKFSRDANAVIGIIGVGIEPVSK